MLKWILGIAGGLVWCALVFVISLWATFPSAAIVERVRYEVQEASNGAYAMKARKASPWWTGVSLADVELLTIDRKSGEGSVVLVADSVAARTSLWSLLGSSLPIHGVVDLGGSDLVVEAELDRSENPPKLRRVEGHADALSVEALGALLAPYGVTLTGKGDVEVEMDMEIADDVKGHDGRISAKGKNLDLSIAMPDPLTGEGEFVLGPMAVSSLDLVVDVRNGRATIKKGLIRSDHANVNLSGTLTLNNNLIRSRLRGELVVGDLGGQLATFESFLSKAKWDDGQYHYRASCTLDRFNAKCLQPNARRGAGTPTRRPSPNPVVIGDADGVDGEKSAEQLREERRLQREARLQERRDRIASEQQPQRPEQQPDDELLDEDDEDLMDEDEGVDEIPELINPDPALLQRPDMNLLPPGGAIPFPPEPGAVPEFE